ncbi:S49 family peptidase, partial [Halolamina salina]
MENPIDRYVATALRSYTVLAIVGLVIGATIAAPFAAGVVSSEPDRIAVVSIDETITGTTAQETISRLRQLRTDGSVKAVVLRISSPGGSAAASEQLYLAVKRLADEKPVVTSVGQYAASGAYYTAIPSEEIYVTPASIVGHVGVIGTAPSDGLSAQSTTGADKAHRGMTRDQYFAALESMKRAFVGAVMTERGDRLSVSRGTVALASAYHGGAMHVLSFDDRLTGAKG